MLEGPFGDIKKLFEKTLSAEKDQKVRPQPANNVH